jgi:hypothetical protein
MLAIPFAPLALRFGGRLPVERLALLQQGIHDAGDLRPCGRLPIDLLA